MITWGVGAKYARTAVEIYLDVLAGRGCRCVQHGDRSEPCRAVYESARMDRLAVVDGHPDLTAELRAAAECVLAREH